MKRFTVLLAMCTCGVVLAAAAQTLPSAPPPAPPARTTHVAPGYFVGELNGKQEGYVRSFESESESNSEQIDPRHANRLGATPSLGAAPSPPSTSDRTQAQRDAARRRADAARIDQAVDEARRQADQRMSAGSTALATGVASVAGQMATQPVGQPNEDIETLTQRVLTQTGQDANTDVRDVASQVQRENQRQHALREHAECVRNASNANQCPCPSGTRRVNEQCVVAGN